MVTRKCSWNILPLHAALFHRATTLNALIYIYIATPWNWSNPKEDSRSRTERTARPQGLHLALYNSGSWMPKPLRCRAGDLSIRVQTRLGRSWQSLASRLKHFLSPEARRVLKPKSKVLRLTLTLKINCTWKLQSQVPSMPGKEIDVCLNPYKPRDRWNWTSLPLDSSVTPTKSACRSEPHRLCWE